MRSAGLTCVPSTGRFLTTVDLLRIIGIFLQSSGLAAKDVKELSASVLILTMVINLIFMPLFQI